MLGANKIRLDWVNVRACPTIEVKSLLLPFCIGCFICSTSFDLTPILSASETLFQGANAAGPWEIETISGDTAQAAFDPLVKLQPENATTSKVAIIAGALVLAILLTKAVVQAFDQ